MFCLVKGYGILYYGIMVYRLKVQITFNDIISNTNKKNDFNLLIMQIFILTVYTSWIPY